MTFIYETTHFRAEAHPRPHVSRTDGGHIRIITKEAHLWDRSDLSPTMAVEIAWMITLVGEAMQKAMNERGIPVVKINYQEMWNWAFKKWERPIFHIHLYGRARDAKVQIFPEAVYLPDRSTGFYDNFEPLNQEDMSSIQKHIALLEKESKYKQSEWRM
jgi:diadenosine tetraphosphate (Ap4A) HIT family hydrolase